MPGQHVHCTYQQSCGGKDLDILYARATCRYPVPAGRAVVDRILIYCMPGQHVHRTCQKSCGGQDLNICQSNMSTVPASRAVVDRILIYVSQDNMSTIPARRALVDRILIYVSQGNMSTVPARRAVVDEIFTISQGRNSHLHTEHPSQQVFRAALEQAQVRTQGASDLKIIHSPCNFQQNFKVLTRLKGQYHEIFGLHFFSSN